jgi:ABC-2 type transport system ATP-binding protein
MGMIEVSHLSYAYGRVEALRDLDLSVPEGALFALLGPNGSGKTTLLQIIMGLRRAQVGRVSLFGVDRRALSLRQRARIAWVGAGQPLPGWMRLEQLEAYLAPLYPEWDLALARELRERFDLDPRRRVDTFSKGEHAKAALLCALAPRPTLLLMDEPFTGMDALVKDDLVRGLLSSAGSEGWTVVIASHDIAELALLADWVGILSHGQMRECDSMERLASRYTRVSVVLDDSSLAERRAGDDWLSIERSGRRLTFVTPHGGRGFIESVLPARFPGAIQIEARDASLHEIFVALGRHASSANQPEVAA